MQPLYSVDHEMRHNSIRTEEGVQAETEDTPLLRRFPPANVERGAFMVISVSLLITILVMGVFIGSYLLVLQNNSENILPPVETPLQLVSRKQWQSLASSEPVQLLVSTLPVQANQVIVVQTDTQPCFTTYSCAVLLKNLQSDTPESNKTLPYNFLLSSNGQTYEALGWHQSSPLFPQYPQSLLLAFIGNFTDTPPSTMQLVEAKNFFADSVSRQHLSPNYIVFGKTMAYNPTRLFQSLNSLPQWRNELTDE